MMVRLTWDILRGKRKKYGALLLCVAVCLFFTLAVDTMYRGYCDAQIENAYDYGGRWDVSIRIKGKDMEKYRTPPDGFMELAGWHTAVWSLRLDPVPEDIKGDREYISCYYLSLLGIRSARENVLPYRLREGRWPENGQEVVLPYTVEIGGESPKNGGIKLGGQVRLECGRRIDWEGNCTQAQIKGAEEFLSEGEKTYTVCGFLEYGEYRSDIFVLYGYTGVDSGADAGQEEVVLYYMLPGRSLAGLEEAFRRLEAEEDILEVSKNSFLADALWVMEQSDYLRLVRYGLYLVEGVLVLVGVCIAGAGQYQGLREDRRQVRLFCSVGAGRGQIYALYCMANALTVLAGFLVSFLLYYAFIGLVRLSVLSGVRNMFFKAGSFAPDVRFCAAALAVFLAVLAVVTAAALRGNLPAYRERAPRGRKRKPRQKGIAGFPALAAGNLRQTGFRRVVQVLIFLALLLFVPVCTLTARSVWQTAAGITRVGSADFFMMKGGYAWDLDGELAGLSCVKRVRKIMGGERRTYLLPEYLGEDVTDALRSLYQRKDVGFAYQPFTENWELKDRLRENIDVIFVDEKAYGSLEELNPGRVPPYAEFCSGQGALLWGGILSPSGELIDVGEQIFARTDSLTCYSFVDEEINYPLHIIGSIPNTKAKPDSLSGICLSAYVPDRLRDSLTMDMATMTCYDVDGYRASLEQLGRTLQELAYRYGYHLQDNISASSAKKDALVIQSASIFALVAVVLVLGVAALGVLGKLDYLSRQQSYEVYRILGLERGRAFALHLLEQMIPLLDAVLAGAVLHCMLYFTLLNGLYGYYGIGLPAVTLAYLLCIAGVVLVLAGNAAVVTGKRYGEAGRKRHLPEKA